MVEKKEKPYRGILMDWKLMKDYFYTGGDVLIGTNIGDELFDGKIIHTSSIVELNVEKGYCETKNSVYHLGNKAKEKE